MVVEILVALVLTLILVSAHYCWIDRPFRWAILESEVSSEQVKLCMLLLEGTVRPDDPALQALRRAAARLSDSIPRLHRGDGMYSQDDQQQTQRMIELIETHEVRELAAIHDRLLEILSQAYLLNILPTMPFRLLWTRLRSYLGGSKEAAMQPLALPRKPDFGAAFVERRLTPIRYRYSI